MRLRREVTASAAPILLAAGLIAGSCGVTPRGAAGSLEPCRVPGVDEEARCGRYEVFEDRAARKGRKIQLNIVVLPAKGPAAAAADPLVFLAGGGVAPATRYAAFLSGAYASLRRQRDILLVDQRGSGGSNALECDLSTDPSSPDYRDAGRFLAAVRRCRAALETKADLRCYTTPLAMDDLDEVRGWLGYPRLNLYGVSYGTTAAMVYLRRHPDRVRTAVLQGVVPLDVPMWLEAPRSAQEALGRVFAACGRQPACREAFPGLEGELGSLLDRLARAPVAVETDGAEAEPRRAPVTIDDEVLRGFLVSMLYSASRIHDLPLILHLAHEGDYRPLAERAARRGESGIPKGVYLSIVCSEMIPRFDPAALPAMTAGTFLGRFRVEREIAACREWVKGWLPRRFGDPVRSDRPVLILTGELDHLTPPRYAERVARTLTRSRRLVLPRRGHDDTDPCVNGMIEAFVIAGDHADLDTSCLARTEDLSFALRRDDLAR